MTTTDIEPAEAFARHALSVVNHENKRDGFEASVETLAELIESDRAAVRRAVIEEVVGSLQEDIVLLSRVRDSLLISDHLQKDYVDAAIALLGDLVARFGEPLSTPTEQKGTEQ